MTADAPLLSPEARARRDEILRLGLRSLRRRRVRRHAALGVCVVAPAAALALVVLRAAPVGPAAPPPVAPRHAIALISDDPTIVSRWAVPDSRPATAAIDDDALRDLLAQAGLPTGLVRTGGHTLAEFQIARAANPDATEAAPSNDHIR